MVLLWVPQVFVTEYYTASWDGSVTSHTFLAVLHIWIILISSSHNALECLSLWCIQTTIMKFIKLTQYLRTDHILWKKINYLLCGGYWALLVYMLIGQVQVLLPVSRSSISAASDKSCMEM